MALSRTSSAENGASVRMRAEIEATYIHPFAPTTKDGTINAFLSTHRTLCAPPPKFPLMHDEKSDERAVEKV